MISELQLEGGANLARGIIVWRKRHSKHSPSSPPGKASGTRKQDSLGKCRWNCKATSVKNDTPLAVEDYVLYGLEDMLRYMDFFLRQWVAIE